MKSDSRQKAKEIFPEISDRNQQQMKAYRMMDESDLFSHQWVSVKIDAHDLPGFKGPRVVCAQCGEGINFQREVVRDGVTLCRSCAGESYYQPL